MAQNRNQEMTALREHADVSDRLDAGGDVALADRPAGKQSSELMAEVERFPAATGGDVRPALRNLRAQMKIAKEAGRIDELVRAMRLALTPTLDFTSAQALFRLFKTLPPSARGKTRLRLAILGGFTTHQLRDLIELYSFAAGV